jgi:hypothetical protein
MSVVGLGLEFARRDDGSAGPPTIRMRMAPGSAFELLQQVCDGHGYQPTKHATFSLGFWKLHGCEYGFGCVIADWEYVGGEPWARRTFTRTVATGSGHQQLTEETTFLLRHTPIK